MRWGRDKKEKKYGRKEKEGKRKGRALRYAGRVFLSAC